MDEKTIIRLSAISSFAFAFFCLLWIALSLIFIPVSNADLDYSILVNDPQWNLATSVGLLTSVFGLFAVLGLYFVNRTKGGVLFFIGVVVLVIGLIFEFASLTWDLFIMPVLCATEKYNSFVSEGVLLESTQFKVFIITMLISLLLGNILTGIALFKAKNFGKLIPFFLILGIILYFAGSISSFYIGSLGLFIYSLSFIFIGLKLWKK